MALFARGHVLLEGDVGIGKTTLLRAFSRAIGGDFERVEGTVDLMPGDLIYHTYVDAEGKPRIDPGPLLRHGERLATFFFNEINRARPQVQSLLLRAMAERIVSAFNREYPFPAHDGVRRPQQGREGGDLRAGVRRARPLHVRTAHAHAAPSPTSRSSLVFDPHFHDVDTVLDRCLTGMFAVAGAQRDRRRDSTQRQASETIERYVMRLWDATERPSQFGVALDGVDMDRLFSPVPARAG